MVNIWYHTLIDIFFTHKYCHVITSPIIPHPMILSNFYAIFVIVLVIGIITAPYWISYKISMSAPNKSAFILLVVTTNPDRAIIKNAVTWNIIDEFYSRWWTIFGIIIYGYFQKFYPPKVQKITCTWSTIWNIIQYLLN